MSLLSNPAFGPRVALVYVTLGALIDVWTVAYYWFFVRGGNPEDNSRVWFWLAGLFFTGVTLIVLGLLLGPLGRAARKAELPPESATRAEAQLQHTAAANQPQVVQGTMGMPGAMPASNMVPGGGVMAPQPGMPPAPAPYVAPAGGPRL